MGQDDDLASRQTVGACRDFLKLLHDPSRRHQEGSAKSICIALLTRALLFMAIQNLRIPAGRNEMAALMSRRLRPSFLRVTGVQEHARAESIVICKQTGDGAIESAHVDSNAQLHLKQRDNVRNGPETQPEVMAQFGSIMFCLSPNIPTQNWPLRRIVARRPNAEKI